MTDPRIPEIDPRLRDRIAELPEEVQAARDLWPEIRAQLDADRVRSLGLRERAPAKRSDRARWLMRAAGLVLIIGGTAAITTYLVRAGGPTVVVIDTTQATRAINRFASYEKSADDLERALDQRRAKLDPKTVEAIERSLRTIDEALDEARAALLRDPAIELVSGYVEAAYRQKIDFLRRANDVANLWTL